ncbi:pol ii transcription elongation factor [Moniliophthora roreri]|nr:pol ii transcription elongation factor [Moniliophthora roreri]
MPPNSGNDQQLSQDVKPAINQVSSIVRMPSLGLVMTIKSSLAAVTIKSIEAMMGFFQMT